MDSSSNIAAGGGTTDTGLAGGSYPIVVYIGSGTGYKWYKKITNSVTSSKNVLWLKFNTAATKVIGVLESLTSTYYLILFVLSTTDGSMGNSYSVANGDKV